MKIFDNFLDIMTIIVIIIFTIFMIFIIDNWWIALPILIFMPQLGLFMLATYKYGSTIYRQSMETYRKVLESDKGTLERARRQKLKKSYYDFKKRVEKIRSKELREIRMEYISYVLCVILWYIVVFTIMALFLMKKFYLL